MTAVIIEDESLSAERLNHLINQVDANIQVLCVLDSTEGAVEWFRDNTHPDVLFLDIQLGDGSAFDFLGSVTVTSSIIFTTAYDEYAIKAFKYNSIDYLLKPIEKRALIDALNKFMALSVKNIGKKGHQLQTVRKIITNEYQKRFLIKIGEQYKNLLMEDINFFYSRAGQCYIHTGSAQHLPIDHSLDHLVDKVNPLDFFRVNRQYLIKSTSIVEIHTYFNSRLLLKLSPDNTEVIVSRDRVNDFKRWLDS